MKTIGRRSFVAIGAGGVVRILQGGVPSKPKNSTSKRRRLLFNWDGSMIHCWGRAALNSQEGPLTPEQFTALVFTPIEDTAVDTLLFSFGSGNVAEYQSNVLEWPGEADNFKFPASKNWHGGTVEVDPKDQYLNPKSLADTGHNPPALIVEECRKRGLSVFVSLRMNDCHDGQHPRDAFPNPELPSFKRQNPDWLVEDLDWWSALNYTLPQVRALKLRVIEEFFDRWDFDGIELDWLRHTLYFPRGTERENGKYLTEFMRAVRKSLNQRALRRGRAIEIAVRVPEKVEWCLEGGFEVPTWISEGLVDLLILGQGVTESPGLLEFRKLMTVRKLPIYPCIYAYGNGYQVSPDEVVRGSAANLWRDGADGLYAFNWFFHGPWRKHLLNQIVDPRLLSKMDKHYTLVQRFEATPREPGGDYIRYNTSLRDAPVPFPLTKGEGVSVFIPVGDTLASSPNRLRQAELWMGLDYLQAGDMLRLVLNDHVLEPPELDIAGSLQKVGYAIQIPPGNGFLGFPSERTLDMTFKALRLEVPPRLLVQGRNKLWIEVIKRGPGTDKLLRVSRIELLTRS